MPRLSWSAPAAPPPRSRPCGPRRRNSASPTKKPVISRLVSFDHPCEIKPGMVFALETFWPSTDGWSAARIEEEIVVTETGHEVITRFPAEELLVAGRH